jgi:ribosomal protein S8
MKYTFTDLLNKITLGYRKKKLTILTQFTPNNLKILKFLLENKLISGFEKKSQKKNALLLVFLNYHRYSPALQDLSITRKYSQQYENQ